VTIVRTWIFERQIEDSDRTEASQILWKIGALFAVLMIPLLWGVTSFRLITLFQTTWLHIPENWNFRYSHVIMLVCNAVAQLFEALL
jgi:hypothetical protein